MQGGQATGELVAARDWLTVFLKKRCKSYYKRTTCSVARHFFRWSRISRVNLPNIWDNYLE
jgi:hypothetical protein